MMKSQSPKILNLHDALRLNAVLGKYLDNQKQDISVIDLAASILEKIKTSPMDYLECLSIFKGVPKNQIDLFDKNGALVVFMNGLKENRVLELHNRLKVLGQK